MPGLFDFRRFKELECGQYETKQRQMLYIEDVRKKSGAGTGTVDATSI
jgi:hypothetical protein